MSTDKEHGAEPPVKRSPPRKPSPKPKPKSQPAKGEDQDVPSTSAEKVGERSRIHDSKADIVKSTTVPFVPPLYPYDGLSTLARSAAVLLGGAVDCSVGTPCDDPPPSVIRALGVSGTERGYPSSQGSVAFRRSAADWINRRFGVGIEADGLAACLGTKEFVASVPHYLKLRNPTKDTVLYPAVSYPTYAMGATLATCRAIPVPPKDSDGSGMDLDAVDKADVERALMLWVNSPSNPTGGLVDLAEVASWGRRHHIPVFSDECYTEFTWSIAPSSILQEGIKGVIAVHSLSKRSNLAGLRIGMYAGDPELVAYLRLVRQHAGCMLAGPLQAAGSLAFADDAHVLSQRERYFERLAFFAETLSQRGCQVKTPDGGFYLWAEVPKRFSDAMEMASELAATVGLLVSPGDFYGPSGCGYVRIAMVQPMAKLQMVAKRFDESGWSP